MFRHTRGAHNCLDYVFLRQRGNTRATDGSTVVEAVATFYILQHEAIVHTSNKQPSVQYETALRSFPSPCRELANGARGVYPEYKRTRKIGPKIIAVRSPHQLDGSNEGLA